MHHTILSQVIVLLMVSVFVVIVFRRLQLPPIIGYLGVGMITGPYGMGWISAVDDFHLIAEFGVVFLLFTTGLEFSLSKLWGMRHSVFGIGGGQVIVTAGIIGVVVVFFGHSWEEAFVVGGALAMSSTAIVVKQLQDQVELRSRHGQLGVGILLFQDLAVVPFLVVIPVLTQAESQLLVPLSMALFKGITIFVLLIAAGHWLVGPLFHEVAQARSTELFTLTVLLITLGAAFLTGLFGLSLVLGAFAAGMMLSETQYKQQIELEIRSFQDVLLGLFFIVIGMTIDFHVLINLWHWLLPAVILLLTVKTYLIFIVAKVLGIEPGVGLRAGLVLSQGGEFGFVLLVLALNNHVLTGDVQQFVLGVIFLSMLLAPLIIRFNGNVARLWCGISYRKGLKNIVDRVAEDASEISAHVIICGFSDVGQKVATALDQSQIRWVGLDINPSLVTQSRAEKKPIDYGDACRPEILRAAGVARAKAVIVTFVDFSATMKLLTQLRMQEMDIPVIVRTIHDGDMTQLRNAGATEVIPDLIESSLIVVSRLLYYLENQKSSDTQPDVPNQKPVLFSKNSS